MKYEDALQEWGAKKIQEKYCDIASRPIVVKMNFNEGYACCGGTDPDCYCSFAESPSAEVNIVDRDGRSVRIDAEDFDFAKVLGEIIEAGGGTVSV